MKTILVGIILFCTAQAGFTQVSDTVSLHQINGYPPKLNECLSVYHDGWSFYFKYSLFEETIQKKKSQMNEKDAQFLNYLFENVTVRFKINGGELRLKDW
ncbi:MAG: hypothetical protein ACI857_001544 [Arenicella sp.]|jgi:hypothetical protein